MTNRKLMTAEYPYLNLSLRYVHGSKSTTVFSYPSKTKAPKAPFDATGIISGFINVSEFYVLGCHAGRRFFSFISVDDADHTGARLELTLTVDSDVLLPGRTVLSLINSVKEMLEQDEPFNDDTLATALASSGFPTEPLRSSVRFQGNDVENRPCYRTYVSATELATIISFPRQTAYAQYSEVALVHVTSAPVADKQLPQITEPVSQAFTVVCPAGVTPSAESVEITDHLALTYTRPGFEAATVNFEVGTTNRYVRIAGPALLVNDAEKAGIVFTQRIPYEIKSSKGNTVSAYTILINGRTATRNDGSFEIHSSDFSNDGKVNISVSSTNYFTTTADYTCEELLEAGTLELVLVPEELPVTLRMDFGDGRTMEQEIMLEKSSPEYCQLRAGNFHGFRAHRLMGHEPETYNVDMSVHTQPAPKSYRTEAEPQKAAPVQAAAVKEQKAEADTPTPTETQAPKPEPAAEKPSKAELKQERPKSAAELRAEKLRRDIPQKMDSTDSQAKADAEKEREARRKKFAYAADRPEKVDILKDDPDDDDTKRRSLSPMIIAAVAVVLITVGIVWYLFTLLPSDSTQEEEAALTEMTDSMAQSRIAVIDDVPDETAASQATPAAQPAEPEQQPASGALTADEKADIEYLNSHNVWRPADMKSDKFKQFLTSLSDGDIDALANSDYFAVADAATNRKAVLMMDLLWKAKGTFQENNNRKVLRGTKDKESIDLTKVVDDLARRQDKTPNTEPRPKR
ncbi:MAG: hypothetical protein NC043_04175 [Muribaculaceae bacterium]|nr:hypothetical protein [Muribaculaceae bacterium]